MADEEGRRGEEETRGVYLAYLVLSTRGYHLELGDWRSHLSTLCSLCLAIFGSIVHLHSLVTSCCYHLCFTKYKELPLKQSPRIRFDHLPHFGLSTVNKPKLRLVIDAKAEFAGVSLNTQLLTGPDCYTSLVGVLFRFPEGQYAVTGDICEMFHHIKINENDQRLQCFLWREGNTAIEPSCYIMQVLIFGATCSPCILQYVKKKIR